MPLKSANFRTVHKYVLARFILKRLWFQNVKHNEILLRGDRNVGNGEFSEENLPELSAVVEGHEAEGGGDGEEAEREAPVEPAVRPVDDQQNEDAGDTHQVEEGEHLEASLSKAFLGSDCDQYEENPEYPACRPGDGQEHKLSIRVLSVKLLSHEIGIDVLKISTRGSHHGPCQMAYRVGGAVDENHIPADLVEQDLLVNHKAV